MRKVWMWDGVIPFILASSGADPDFRAIVFRLNQNINQGIGERALRLKTDYILFCSVRLSFG